MLQRVRNEFAVRPGTPRRVLALLQNGIMSMLREELVAEAIVRQMPSLSREEFSRRMTCLGNHPDGRIAQAYACFLLLRRQPPSPEKSFHWAQMTATLRQALQEEEKNG